MGLLLPLVLFLLARFAFPASSDNDRYANAFERKFAASCAMDIRNQFAKTTNVYGEAFRALSDETCLCTTKAVFTKLSWAELGQVNGEVKVDGAIAQKLVREYDVCAVALEAFVNGAPK